MGKISVTDTTEVELTITTAVNKCWTLEAKGLSNILLQVEVVWFREQWWHWHKRDSGEILFGGEHVYQATFKLKYKCNELLLMNVWPVNLNNS